MFDQYVPRNFVQELMDSMPMYLGEYRTSTNIGAVFAVEQRQLADVWETIYNMFAVLDVDSATGANLDVFLTNLDLIRGAKSDDLVRTEIVTKTAANFSKGQIETVKQAAISVFGSDYIGITETWNDPKYLTPSGIVIKLAKTLDPEVLTEKNIDNVVNGGVKVEYEIQFNTHAVLATKTHAELSAYTHAELRSATIT